MIKFKLPIVEFHAVKELHVKTICRDGLFEYETHQVLIAPDPYAGQKGRYSIIYLQMTFGKMSMIGRELRLSHARQITSDFLRDLGENYSGSEAHVMGFSNTRKLYERGSI